MIEVTTSWHEKGRGKGRMESRTEGEADGTFKGKIEIARNMILEGFPISLITKMTGLPEFEITKLQQGVRNLINYQNLTQNEKEILSLIVQGKCNEEIANTLFLSYGATKAIVCKLLKRFKVKNRIQLAVFAVRNYLA